MPAGRPTKLTPEVKRKIADCFLCAFTDAQTAELVELNVRTIERIRAGTFCRDIKRAEIERELKYRMRLWTSKTLPAGICWMLERKYPGQLAKPEVQMQITNNTLNQTTNNALIISAEAAEGVLNRIQSADAKVGSLFKKRNGNDNGHHKTVEE